jgi:hypothetical protein
VNESDSSAGLTIGDPVVDPIRAEIAGQPNDQEIKRLGVA